MHLGWEGGAANARTEIADAGADTRADGKSRASANCYAEAGSEPGVSAKSINGLSPRAVTECNPQPFHTPSWSTLSRGGMKLACVSLGAHPRSIATLIVGRGAYLATIGIAFGLVIALAARSWVEPLLFNTLATDPVVFVAVIVARGVNYCDRTTTDIAIIRLSLSSAVWFAQPSNPHFHP